MALQGFPTKSEESTAAADRAKAWLITLMLFLSMTLNFVDRLVLANVAPVLRSELSLSNTQYSYIVFAFMFGMALGQVPAGALVDRIGARRALPGILTGWSAANALHALASGAAGFSGLRFIMGLFECGNYSSGLKVIGAIMPARQRALALGIFDSGSLMGSIVAPPLVVFIMSRWGWRSAFLLPSFLGLLWIAPWLWLTRNGSRASGPHSAPCARVNVSGLLHIRQTWGVILMRSFAGPVSQFYWYWLPLYLVRGRGMSMAAMAMLSSVAYLLGGAGNLAGGSLSGWLIHRGYGIDFARKTMFAVGVSSAAASVFVPMVPNLSVAVFLVALAIFGLNVASCNLIAVITDVFPEHTLARVTGMSGLGEGLVNMTLVIVTGMVVDRYSFAPVFAGAGILPLASLAALLFVVRRCDRVEVKGC